MERKEIMQLLQDASEQTGKSYEERSIHDNKFDDLADSILNLASEKITPEGLLALGYKSGTDDGNNYWFIKDDTTINYSAVDVFTLEGDETEIKYLIEIPRLNKA